MICKEKWLLKLHELTLISFLDRLSHMCIIEHGNGSACFQPQTVNNHSKENFCFEVKIEESEKASSR